MSRISEILTFKVQQFIKDPKLSQRDFLIKKTLFYWTMFNWSGVIILTILGLILGADPIFWYGVALSIMFVVTFIFFGTKIPFTPSYIAQLYLYILVTTVYAAHMGGILHSGGIMLTGMCCMLMTAPFRSLKVSTYMVLFYILTMIILVIIDPYLQDHPGLSETNNAVFFTINMIWISSAQVLFILYFFKNLEELEESEKKYMKELDETKTRLYTNITHEFRTPITLILGMADQIKSLDLKSRNAIINIKNNGNKLLRLVNQMLNLSKLEAGILTTQKIQSDIVAYIAFIIENSAASASQKEIKLSYYPKINELVMDFDPEKIEEIMSNLLSNAIRYTQKEGKIEVYLTTHKETPNPSVTISVKDNGIGISPEHIDYIFDRFYQAENNYRHHQEGSGIGLALVKENVKLLDGEIKITSQEGIGSTFTVILPVTNKAEIKPVIYSSSERRKEKELKENHLQEERHGQKDRPILLIIEDHPEMIDYIQSILENDYEVVTADNGRSGLRQATKYIPDIIISDVMMPEMDGFEFLDKLKSNIRTNHIPVILLTARADLPSRLEGLELGAEAYLSKPFNEKELQIRLRKMLEQRKILQNRYLSSNMLEYPADNLFPNEDQFMEDIHTILKEHLDEENFGVNELAHSVGMSRSQLYRKFNALTSTTVDKYIRKYRLHQAMHLLKTTELNISQAALEVGILNSAYFSRIFKAEFGCSPSEVSSKKAVH